MKSKIRVLDEHTINKIAAGEVIENPASVVKELVENSLDAGAREVIVEIKGGGRDLIRISDDGCGMYQDDALLCLERHATSKIREVEEIHDIYTMGFRGEAIPSIASISKFTLMTSPASEENQKSVIGTMVIVDGGKILSCSPVARSPGTTIEVKSLFFNLPVRKKFLKSPAVDANEITKILTIISLGHPEVKFQLIIDNKSMLLCKTSPENSFCNSLNERIGSVLSQDFLRNSLFIEKKSEEILIQGRIGLPSQTRHNRTGQYLFINRRPIFSPLIAYAVKQGYGTSLSDSRYPVFVLHLSLPGHLIDVNVHPQKREVRLRQESSIKEMVIKAVQAGLCFVEESGDANRVDRMPLKKQEFIETQTENSKEWIFQQRPPSFSWADTISITSPALKDLSLEDKEKDKFEKAATQLPLYESRLTAPKVVATIPRYIILDISPNEFLDRIFPSLKKGGLCLVDQKAAHARVIFDSLSTLKTGKKLAQQSLLIPYQIELSRHETDLLRHSLNTLQGYGIHIQEFGSNTFLVDAIPQIFGNSNLEEFFTQVLVDLSDAAKCSEMDQRINREIDKKLAMAASRAAISHTQISLIEAQELIKQLTNSKEPYECPSGKKTITYLVPEEISKYFHR
jgi:DNA mismatch repair protein MutL